MVNYNTQLSPPAPLTRIPDASAETHDLLIEDRSRIIIVTVAPNNAANAVCHIHASKQITILDGYAEVNLPDGCIKLYSGQSVNIPNGTVHCINNFGKIPLKYVEIRTGPYVMDDDQLNYSNN